MSPSMAVVGWRRCFSDHLLFSFFLLCLIFHSSERGKAFWGLVYILSAILSSFES